MDLNKDTIIEQLQLEELVDPEGGYYKRTYNSPHTLNVSKPDGRTVVRMTMTSIYFMLSEDRQIGYMHKNEFDVMLYYQLGRPIKFTLLYMNGRLEERILGPGVLSGEKLQLFAPAGVWIGSMLMPGGMCDFGLTSEATSPGFEYEDMTLATNDLIRTLHPQHWDAVKHLIPQNK